MTSSVFCNGGNGIRKHLDMLKELNCSRWTEQVSQCALFLIVMKNSAKFLNELWAYYTDSFFRNREGFPLLILLEGLD